VIPQTLFQELRAPWGKEVVNSTLLAPSILVEWIHNAQLNRQSKTMNKLLSESSNHY
jgi:hypothetical protein